MSVMPNITDNLMYKIIYQLCLYVNYIWAVIQFVGHILFL